MFYFRQNIGLFFILLSPCFAYDDFDVLQDVYFMRNVKGPESNQKFALFNYLDIYEVNASKTTEKDYPWIARVVHSTTMQIPHMCTAACIDNGIFITASRCIFKDALVYLRYAIFVDPASGYREDSLKVKYTSIVYKSKLLPVRAFVLPSNPTTQKFDDIGFIVIEGNPITKYDAIALFDEVNRTDDAFNWFDEHELSGEYKVIGYAATKGPHVNRIPEREFHLTELNVTVGLDICSTILTCKNTIAIEGFKVPCYHSCTLEQFYKIKKDQACKSYHGVEGGAIIDTSNTLFGLATWGAYFSSYELPVGFSVVNSINFFEDFQCAKKIRDSIAQSGYQNIC